MIIFVHETKRQNLGHKGADLFGREIDHGGDLFADQVFGAIVLRDLGGCLLFPDLWSEIDIQFDGGTACLRKRFGPCDSANADIDIKKIIVTDCHLYSP